MSDSLSVPPKALLIEVLSGPMDGLEFCFDKALITIGRANTNDLCLTLDLLVSRAHARLSREGEDLWLEDVKSLNGTYIGEQRLTAKTRVSPGEIFRVGMTDLRINFTPGINPGRGMEKGHNLSPASDRVLDLAHEESLHLRHQFIGTEHLFIGLCKCRDELVERVLAQDAVDPTILRVLRELIIPSSHIPPPTGMIFTPRMQNLLKLSQESAQEYGATHIAPVHLLLGLLKAGDGLVVRLLRRLRHNPEKLIQAAAELLRETPVQARGRDTPLLNLLGRDLTRLASQGRLDPVIGRDAELALMVQTLLRKKK